MKRVLAITAAATLMSIGIAPAAHAGEVTGNGDPTPIQSRSTPASECAFSGLDDLSDAEAPSPDTRPRITQSYGQIIKVVGPVKGAFTPANSGCNKNKPPVG